MVVSLKHLKGEPLEYVLSLTGEALFPSLNFAHMLLPHAFSVSDPDFPLFSEGKYLGHSIKQVKKCNGTNLLPVDKARRLVLKTDILIHSREVAYPPSQII